MADKGKHFTYLVIALFCSSLAHAQKQVPTEQKDSIDNSNDIIKMADNHSAKGGINNVLDVLSGQAAGVNVSSNGLDRMACSIAYACAVRPPSLAETTLWC